MSPRPYVHILGEPTAQEGRRVCIGMKAIGLNLVFAGCVVVVMPTIPARAAVYFDRDCHPIPWLEELAVVVHCPGRVVTDLGDGRNDLMPSDVREDRRAPQFLGLPLEDVPVGPANAR